MLPCKVGLVGSAGLTRAIADVPVFLHGCPPSQVSTRVPQIHGRQGHNRPFDRAALYPLEEITSSLGLGLGAWPGIGGQVLIKSLYGGEPVTAEPLALDQSVTQKEADMPWRVAGIFRRLLGRDPFRHEDLPHSCAFGADVTWSYGRNCTIDSPLHDEAYLVLQRQLRRPVVPTPAERQTLLTPGVSKCFTSPSSNFEIPPKGF